VAQVQYRAEEEDYCLNRQVTSWVRRSLNREVLVQGMKSIPWIFKLQFAVIGVSLCAALVVGKLANQPEYERIAFALPAAEAVQPWNMRVNRFAHKLSRGFGVKITTAREFSAWLLEAADRQHLEPELLASVVLTESSFRKNVQSHVGAIGPAQVRPNFWRGFCGSSDLSDPGENIYCGAQILSHYKDRCGSESCALHAYNVGINNHRAGHRKVAGQRYVAKVDRNRSRLEKTLL
jgi:soluble lytic murein transglycosylase-like protein